MMGGSNGMLKILFHAETLKVGTTRTRQINSPCGTYYCCC